MVNELKNLSQILSNFLSENGIIHEVFLILENYNLILKAVLDLSENPADIHSFSREMVDIVIKNFKSMKSQFELTEKNVFELSQLNIELSSQLNLAKMELMAAKSSAEECRFNKFAASKVEVEYVSFFIFRYLNNCKRSRMLI